MSKRLAFGMIVLFFCSIFFGYSQKGNSQVLAIDTIEIEEQTFARSGVDSIVDDYGLDLLSFPDLMGSQAGIYSRIYAPGQSASTSILGSTSNQVNLVWEGININNGMLGISDLSMIPSFFFSQSYMDYAPTGLNAGIGGNIHLLNRPQDSNFRSQLSLGQFDQYALGLAGRFGPKSFSQEVQIFAEKAGNAYTRNINGKEWRLKNADSEQLAVQYKIHKQFNQAQWNNSLWINVMNRQIPAGGNTNAFSEQYDQNIRFNSDWIQSYRKGVWKLKAAYLQDQIDFKNSFLDERGLIHKAIVGAEIQHQLQQNIEISSLIQGQYSIGQHQSYGDGQRSIGQVQWNNQLNYSSENHRFEIGMLSRLRESFAWDPFVSYKFQIHSVSIGGMLNKATRFATLNDLFWVPGGNSQLRTEKSYKAMIQFEYQQKQDIVELNIFYRKTNDLIQWSPNSNGIWTPENVTKVKSYGFLLKLQKQIIKTKVNQLKTYIDYQWAPSIIVDKLDPYYGNQLIYLPKHQLNGHVAYTYKSWGIQAQNHVYSARFTNSSNSNALAAYSKHDVFFTKKIDCSKLKFAFFAGIYNLSNSLYQSSAGFYQPGRHVRFTIKTQLK